MLSIIKNRILAIIRSIERIVALLLVFLFLVSYANSQKVWTLKECIDFAIENNINLQQAELNQRLSLIDKRQSQNAMLPTFNGNAFAGYAYGQRIDPFTNRFADERIESVNLSLNGSLLLFSGFQVLNRIKQAKYNYTSGQLGIEQATQDLSLNVASAFLQVLFAQERLEISRKLLENSKIQVDRLRKLEAVGNITKADLLNVEALMATEEVNLVQAENQLDLSKLNLLQLMNSKDVDIQISLPSSSQEVEDYAAQTTAEAVYYAALGNQPNIKAAELRAMSANIGIGIARGAFSPTISLTGSVGSGFSSIRQEIDSNSLIITPKPPLMFPTVGGDMVIIPQTPDVNFNLRTIPFANQMNQNLNQQIGVFITIPILNGFQTHQNVKRAKINYENAQLEAENTKIQLRNTVYTAYTDLKAAYKTFIANQKNLEAQKEAFKYLEQRFNAGLIQSFEFNEAKNRLANAEIQLIISKYEYLFRKSVVDFYSGKSLQF